MPGPLRLVLDQGGHASRALLYADGRLLRHAHRVVKTRRPAPGHVEQDPEELVASLEACIAEAVDGAPPVAAAGLACQRSSVVCWSRRTGVALTPVLSWQDTRAHTYFDTLTLDAAAVRATTGLPLSAHYGATKLAWCLRNVAAVRDAQADGDLCMGPLASFLLFRLLDGQPYQCTRTLAQRTLLYDIVADDWSEPLLTAFGLPREALPALVPDCGLRGVLADAGVPLRVCVGDQNGIPFASGQPDATTLYVNAGTGAFLLHPLADGGDAPDQLLRSLLPDGGFAAEGTVNGAGSAVAWYESQARATFPWDALDALDALPVSAPLCVNAVGDLGSPFWRTGVETRFVPDAGKPVERAYAVVESIAFLIRANLERLRAEGLSVQRVRASGGLVASGFACRLIAATLDTPVERSADLEATARGVLALLGGPADTARPIVFTAEQGWVDAMDTRYGHWLKLIG